MGEVLIFTPKRERETVLPNGTRIIIEVVDALDEETGFGDVEEHEAEHAVVAIKNGTTVIEASVIPEGSSLGHVQLGAFDPVAAATSHGRKGNGHDKHIVEQAGHNFASNGAVAHGVIARNKKYVNAVARALAKEKRLTGSRIQHIMNRVDRGNSLRIQIITPDGREQVLMKQTKNHTPVSIPDTLTARDIPMEPLPRVA